MFPKRIDKNHKEIVTALRKLGYSVFNTSSVGQGFPDIIVGSEGKNYLFDKMLKK
jgi:Holliday junction resolvase